MESYNIIPVGDQALSINFPAVIRPEINRRLQILAHQILKADLIGVLTVIPAYHTLMVTYEAIKVSFQEAVEALRPIIDHNLDRPLPPSKIWRIPVCYDEKFGPDLAAVAAFGHMTVNEVVQRHTAKPYLIYFLGFLPGFAYMASVDDQIAMPRLAKPRLQIPAGSVGIAGHQTGFYPVTSPGGWRLIGRTPLTLYQPEHPKAFYQAGDQVQFVAVDVNRFNEIEAADQAGNYQVEVVAR